MFDPTPAFNQGLINAKVGKAKRGTARERGNARADRADRLPPGQVLTDRFPILDLGIRPKFEPSFWSLEIVGEVKRPMKWSWADFDALPAVDLTADFHCVTRWSRYDLRWRGVPFTDLMRRAGPTSQAAFVIFESGDGYTTNVPLRECLAPDVIAATRLEGKTISVDHGGPVRMIIPKLYGWKSAKFLRRIRLAKRDEPGFWETRGYHAHGDPWKEERFG